MPYSTQSRKDLDNHMSSIPVIDFAPFLNGTAEERLAVARQVLDAGTSCGFLYLRNFTRTPEQAENIISQVFGHSRDFFDLPSDLKQEAAWDTSNRGYVGPNRESLDRSVADPKQAFNVGRERAGFPPNRYPSSEVLPSFKNATSEFYEYCLDIGMDVVRCFALAMGIDEEVFAAKHDHSSANSSILRFLCYDYNKTTGEDGRHQAGAHTDYGSVTLLFQEDRIGVSGGLQVMDHTTGQWVDAPYIPGAIVVNTGDLVNRWSNNLLRSTLHRVTAPALPPKSIKHMRYSIAFFLHPNDDEMVECLPGCEGESGAKYPPISARSHLLECLQSSY